MKKPTGGGYGQFLSEKRAEFKKQADAAGDKTAVGPVKLAGAAWKAMGDKEKAPYEKKYQEAKAKFEAFKNSDAYEAPEKKEKKGHKGDAKPKKDKDAPKKPVGGAYGVFGNEKREEFKAKAVAAGDNSFGGGAKLASVAWKAMSDADKASYQKKYEAAKAKYDVDLAKYQLSKPEEPSPEKETETGTKRKASVSSAAPAPKRKAVKTAAAPDGVALDEAVLKEADGLGYKSNLENLARRKVIVDAGIEGPKILRALKASGGLVNKAQHALLGA